MFGLRCKSCDAKEQELKELKALLAKVQDSMHVHRSTASHLMRQSELLKRENPEIWHQYFSKGAKRLKNSKELNAIIDILNARRLLSDNHS